MYSLEFSHACILVLRCANGAHRFVALDIVFGKGVRVLYNLEKQLRCQSYHKRSAWLHPKRGDALYKELHEAELAPQVLLCQKPSVLYKVRDPIFAKNKYIVIKFCVCSLCIFVSQKVQESSS